MYSSMKLTALALLAGYAYGSDKSQVAGAVVPKVDLKKITSLTVGGAQNKKNQNRKLQFIPGVSIICQLSSGFLDEFDDVSVTPDPELIYEDPSNPASLIAVDFGSDADAFDQYDTTCNGFGGQTLKINATLDGTACAFKYDWWNLPLCFGPAGVCTEADAESIAAYILSEIGEDVTGNGCSLFLDTVESDGFGADVQAPNVADSCSNEMIFLFTGAGVYNDYDSVVSETSGMLTGNTTASENFNKACADNEGKVVTANADYPDACDSSDWSEVPACVGMSCTNNDAASFLSFLLGSECQGTTIEIVADDPSNDTSSSGSTSVALTGTVFMAITGWILQLFF